jgi:decaprenylphospho-beta-D-ribofuranose 2-oxidase
MPKPIVPLSGWGRFTTSTAHAARPERLSSAVADFAAPVTESGLCLHGAGRSYGDCAVNGNGDALITTRLDRILAFDPETGIVEVEPGVDFRRLLQVFLPRGFLAPVTPGTGFATIGGALANDVHGKNHEHAGSIGQHVTEFDIVLPDGSARTVTPADTALFRATMGGLGLTGFISRIALRLTQVPGGRVSVHEQRANDLEHFLTLMADAANATYSVGWIDGAAHGTRLGRGILETAEPAESDFSQPRARNIRVPLDFPAIALNPISIAIFNEAYYRRVPEAGRIRSVPWQKFLYPLDAIQDWNRIYGKGGFIQFQCVVPFETGVSALRDLLEVISASRQASFLAVLKRMGPGRAGYLSFPTPGYTLALDFPRRAGIEMLYQRLCRITLDAGGRIYLAKDALLDALSFRRMYPEFGSFSELLAAIDPGHRMQSDMARRLRLRDAP